MTDAASDAESMTIIHSDPPKPRQANRVEKEIRYELLVNIKDFLLNPSKKGLKLKVAKLLKESFATFKWTPSAFLEKLRRKDKEAWSYFLFAIYDHELFCDFKKISPWKGKVLMVAKTSYNDITISAKRDNPLGERILELGFSDCLVIVEPNFVPKIQAVGFLLK